MNPWTPYNVDKIIECVAGSHAYGTNVEGSDFDKRGIFIGDKNYTFGLYKIPSSNSQSLPVVSGKKICVVEDKGNGKDIELIELAHFLTLCSVQSPNIIEILWTDPEDIIFCQPAAQRLIDVRHQLLSSGAKDSFFHYANSQMGRIKGHSKWITKEDAAVEKLITIANEGYTDLIWIEKNFPEKVFIKVRKAVKSPTNFTKNADHFLRDTVLNGVSTYGPQIQFYSKYLDTRGDIKKIDDYEFFKQFYAVKVKDDTYRLYDDCLRDDIGPGIFYDHNKAQVSCHDSTIFESQDYQGVLFVNREQFKKDIKKWKEYQTWVENRNPHRAELEFKFGIDTKHLAHLVRILRMGKEILAEGVVKVKRPDAEELIAIRNGAWTYEDAIKYAASMKEELEELYIKTKLRKEVDKEFLNKLYLETVEEFYYKESK